MATGLKKKSNSSSVNHQNEAINDQLFVTEEQRLLRTSATNYPSNKSIQKFNTLVNQMTPIQIDEELTKRQLPTKGDLEIRLARLKNAHHPEATSASNRSSREVEVIFEYIAVLDFEATCEENRTNFPNEIIEFPIVLIDVQRQTIIDKFQSYCRPVKNPILSKFCTDLTGIEQYQVDSAPTFPEVLQNVERWLNERNLLDLSDGRRLAFATDGPWDFNNFLQLQCQISSIPYPSWAVQWVNVRKGFAKFYSVRSCGITKMLGKLGLSFEGRPHSGLDDATNIAQIVLALLKDGCVLSFNDGISRTDPALQEETDKQTTIDKTKNEDEEDDIIFQS